MENSFLQLSRTDSTNQDFQSLVQQLDDDLAIRDGNEHAFYHQFNTIQNLKNVVVLYKNGIPVACGAFKPFENEMAEIKRMFVVPEERGNGYAGKILGELESWASELKFKSCILETGKKQPEAVALYRKSGFTIIENYGQYKGIENSLCMKKQLNN